MKLSIILPAFNAADVTAECLKLLSENCVTEPEILVIDNGSYPPLQQQLDGREVGEYVVNSPLVRVKNLDKNIGVWDTFKLGFEETTGDILAYFHTDMLIHEKGWDQRVIEAFEKDEKLGLIGFVGSDEWGDNGGRGGGTVSNFQGNQVKDFKGSSAQAHGRQTAELVNALQVDGCAMIMTRKAMQTIGFFDWPPHHFYDRVYSLKMLEAGYHVGVLGIACDHISGQTANTQQGWQDTAREWAEAHGLPMYGDNWDQTIYHEAEGRFLPMLHAFMAGRPLIRCMPNHEIQ